MLNTLPPRHKPKIPPNDAEINNLFNVSKNQNKHIPSYLTNQRIPRNHSFSPILDT